MTPITVRVRGFSRLVPSAEQIPETIHRFAVIRLQPEGGSLMYGDRIMRVTHRTWPQPVPGWDLLRLVPNEDMI